MEPSNMAVAAEARQLLGTTLGALEQHAEAADAWEESGRLRETHSAKETARMYALYERWQAGEIGAEEKFLVELRDNVDRSNYQYELSQQHYIGAKIRAKLPMVLQEVLEELAQMKRMMS
jgi:hypothetical protein